MTRPAHEPQPPWTREWCAWLAGWVCREVQQAWNEAAAIAELDDPGTVDVMLSWPPPEQQEQVLQGAPSKPGHGLEVTIKWRADEQVHGTTEKYVARTPPGGSYRAAPLMLVLEPPQSNGPEPSPRSPTSRAVGVADTSLAAAHGPEPDSTEEVFADCIIVGRARIITAQAADGRFETAVTLSLDAVWTKDGRWRRKRPQEWADEPQLQRVVAALAEPAHPDPGGDVDMIATTIAKGIAEGSRNAMASIRDVRYTLESELTRELDENPGQSPEPVVLAGVLFSLIEIRQAISRVRDFAREGVRTVLATHGTSKPVYHGYRVFRDPKRIVQESDPMTEDELRKIPWISALDAGVRQCERLEAGLKDEIDAISGLLSASATIASAQEAQAQGEFNAVAGAVAVGFGVPALILALYGIDDDPSPFHDIHGFWLFVPLISALVLAAAVWRKSAPSKTVSSHRTLFGIWIAAIVLLVAAAAVATWF